MSGTTRRISSSASTAGRFVTLDSPPMSMIRAPASSSSRARATRACNVRSSGASENESGVALSMPMSAIGACAPPSVRTRPQACSSRRGAGVIGRTVTPGLCRSATQSSLGARAIEESWRAVRPRRPDNTASRRARIRARHAARPRVATVGWIRARAWIEGFSSAQTTKSPELEQLPLPAALVEIEDAGRARSAKVRIAREDPRAVVPRADRVLGQPAPHRDRQRPPRRSRARTASRAISAADQREQRQSADDRRQLAGQRLDLGHLRRGEAPRPAGPRSP